ncbi:MAG: (2Fe-2S)-binding protein [Spirochaetales bacterium]|nr:(2Fe-2S)-binding protein [Spirochaetales bacterium]
MRKINCIVNSKPVSLEVEDGRTLVDMLRQDLGLTGTKKGCGTGDCGACTVLLDGVSVNSCICLAALADGHEITTIEGLQKDGKLSDIQQAFIDHGAVQCGFCSPGMIMSAEYLLENNPDPSDEEIRRALSGNLCRCTGYQQIVDAVRDVAASRRQAD